MDTRTKAVKDACIDLLKGGQRQMRYKLKMKYFNGLSENQVPKISPISSMTDEQWLALVNMWSKSEHKVSLTACYSLKISSCNTCNTILPSTGKVFQKQN